MLDLTAPAMVNERDHSPSSRPSSAERERAGRELETGALVGRYVVVDRIGLQGWGTVYTAFDPELDRKVALKISPAPVADARDGDEPPDDARYRRLLREARVMAQINHPNAVAVHDVGEHDGRVFVTMEKVVGLTLDEWRLERPRTWSEVIEVFVAAGRGLAAAHDVGLVHRNFGPRSIVVAADGHVHVTDFGLARLSDRGSSVAEPGLELTADDGFATGVGARGAVDEALRYMAPERRHTADAAAADQFSFCVALYEALYREHPFGEQSVAEQQLRAAAGRLPSAPTERSVPERIRLAVLRGLSSEPEDRYPHVGDLLTALSAPSRAGRGRLVVAGVVAVAAGVGVWKIRDERARTACERSSAPIESVWGQEAQAELERGLGQTPSPYADEAVRRATEAADGFASRWATARREACEARREGTLEPAQADRVVACLDDSRRAFGATLEVLSQATQTSIFEAVRPLRLLTEPAECLERQPASVGESPDDLEAALARAATYATLERIDEATAAAVKLEARAQQLGVPLIEARATLVLAGLESVRGHHEEARTYASRALELAVAAGGNLVAAAAAQQLVMTVGYYGVNPAGGRSWARLAEMFYEAGGVGEDDPRRCTLVGSLGVVELEEDGPGGVRLLEQAVEEATRLHGEAHPVTVQIEHNLAVGYVHVGDFQRAADTHARVAEAAARLHGPDHPKSAAAMHNLGLALVHVGDARGGLAVLRGALEVRQRILGGDHIEVGVSYVGIAQTTARLRDLETARQSFTAAMRIFSLYPPGLQHVAALVAAAEVLTDDSPHEALVYVDRADALLAEIPASASHPIRSRIFRIRAPLLAVVGRLDEALSVAHQAVAFAAPGSSAWSWRSDAWLAVAYIRMLRREYAEARHALEQAGRREGRDQVQASIDLAEGRPADAVRHAREAYDSVRGSRSPSWETTVDPGIVLAEALVANGELQAAEAQLDEGREAAPLGVPASYALRIAVVQADIELARGDEAAARQALARVDALGGAPFHPWTIDRLAAIRAALL